MYTQCREWKDLNKILVQIDMSILIYLLPTFGVLRNAIWYQPLWREPVGGLLLRFGSSKDINVSK